MKPVNVGIVGCGVIAPTHSEAFQSLKDTKVKWACDLDIAKAKKLAEKYHIDNVTADYMDLLEDPEVDLVSVCTDHASHAAISSESLRNGKNVLCEKALASNSDGLCEMLSAHSANPSLVFSGVFQHRFDAANQYIKHIVEKGAFGTLLTAGLRMHCKRTNDYYEADEWRGTWAKEGGGVMINQALHYVDILCWLAGNVESVSGAYAIRTHEGVIETEDTVTASMRFSSGALGFIEATSSSTREWHPLFSLHGSEGYIEMCNGKAVALSCEDKKLEEEIRTGLAQCHDRPGVQTKKSYYGTGHAAQIEDVVMAVREKRQPFIPAEEACHAVDVVLGIYRSQQQGEWIKIIDRRM